MDALDDNDPLRTWYCDYTRGHYGYPSDFVPEYLRYERTQTDTSSRGKRGKCVLLLMSLSHIYQLVTESILINCQLVLPHIQRPQSSSFHGNVQILPSKGERRGRVRRSMV